MALWPDYSELRRWRDENAPRAKDEFALGLNRIYGSRITKEQANERPARNQRD